MQSVWTKRPSWSQLAALALGIASVFLAWSEIRYGTHYIEARLIDLMVEGGDANFLFLIFGTAFLAGLLSSLWWEKAWFLQLSGLVLLTLTLIGSLGRTTGSEGLLEMLAASLHRMGLGTFLAWTATLISIPLHRPYISRSIHGRDRPSGRSSRRERSKGDHVSTIRIPPRTRDGSGGNGQRPSSNYDQAMAQGSFELSNGDLDSALRSYGRALRACRNASERAACKVQISVVLHRKGDLEEAHLFLQEAKVLDPLSWTNGQGTARLLPMKRPTSKKRIRFGLSPEP
ncbi:MAG: tetratricopeptide repeat protein [Methanomassiliicoccus sp.]|nr:tetratricopeptide repeat protein [Methanomassiliicoccus sp.]